MPDYKGYFNCKADCEVKHRIDPCLLKLGHIHVRKIWESLHEFTGATLALVTHVYTSMHKGHLHQQVCRMTWKSILSKISCRDKAMSNE